MGIPTDMLRTDRNRAKVANEVVEPRSTVDESLVEYASELRKLAGKAFLEMVKYAPRTSSCKVFSPQPLKYSS